MTKPWTVHYAKNTPSEINPDEYSSLVELFETACKKHSDKKAFLSMDCILTYKEFHKKSRQFAAYLQNELKMKKGDTIALMMPNVLQYPVCLFGALMAGLVIINVNPMYTAPELVKQLSDCGTETIVVLANFAHVLQHALPETRVTNVIVTEAGDLCGFFKSRLINFIIKKIRKKIPNWYIPYSTSFKKALNKGNRLRLQKVRIKGDDLAVIQYTGGTTGVSKGAMLTHRNLVANILQSEACFGDAFDGDSITATTVLPLYHVFALTVCCFTFLKLGVFNICNYSAVF